MKKSLIWKIAPLALLAAVCLLVPTACGGLTEKNAQEAAENFMDAWTRTDSNALKKCVDDPEKLPEDVRHFKGMHLSKNAILNGLPKAWSEHKQKIGMLVDKMNEKVMGSAKYTITDVKETGDGYVFTLDVTYPVGDMNQVLRDSLNNTVNQSSLNQLMSKLMKEGKISVSTSPDEMMSVVMTEGLKLVEKAIDEMVFETKTEKLILVVYETEYSEILIKAEKSGFEN